MADTVWWRSGISALTRQWLQLLLKVITRHFIAETSTAQNLSVLFVWNTRPLSYAVTCWLDPGQAGDHLLTLLLSRRRDSSRVIRLGRVKYSAETKDHYCPIHREGVSMLQWAGALSCINDSTAQTPSGTSSSKTVSDCYKLFLRTYPVMRAESMLGRSIKSWTIPR